MEKKSGEQKPGRLNKTPTGIDGLDEITYGGLPRNRTTLVTGGPGCGKTILGMEFLVKGCMEYGETGVFFSFEEDVADLFVNFASMGYDLPQLIRDKKLAMDHVKIDPFETVKEMLITANGLKLIDPDFSADTMNATIGN